MERTGSGWHQVSGLRSDRGWEGIVTREGLGIYKDVDSDWEMSWGRGRKESGNAIPRARKNRMKKRVPSTSPESQAHLEESTAEMPSSMKMTVSAQLARVFIVYLTVVRDLWEMLASTYFLQPKPHIVTLGEEWRDKASEKGSQEAQFWGLNMLQERVWPITGCHTLRPGGMETIQE